MLGETPIFLTSLWLVSAGGGNKALGAHFSVCARC